MVNLMQLGIFLILLGVIILFLSSIKSEKTQVKGGGIAFIGPIPIAGFASDKKTLYILLVLGIVLFSLYLIFNKFINQ